MSSQKAAAAAKSKIARVKRAGRRRRVMKGWSTVLLSQERELLQQEQASRFLHKSASEWRRNEFTKSFSVKSEAWFNECGLSIAKKSRGGNANGEIGRTNGADKKRCSCGVRGIFPVDVRGGMRSAGGAAGGLGCVCGAIDEDFRCAGIGDGDCERRESCDGERLRRAEDGGERACGREHAVRDRFEHQSVHHGGAGDAG